MRYFPVAHKAEMETHITDGRASDEGGELILNRYCFCGTILDPEREIVLRTVEEVMPNHLLFAFGKEGTPYWCPNCCNAIPQLKQEWVSDEEMK